MFNLERWKEIFQSIKKNKLRTALSGMTVSLGILIFIILFGLGEGLKNSYSDLFLNEANNVIFIYPGKTTKPYGGFKTNRIIELKNNDAKILFAYNDFKKLSLHYFECFRGIGANIFLRMINKQPGQVKHSCHPSSKADYMY